MYAIFAKDCIHFRQKSYRFLAETDAILSRLHNQKPRKGEYVKKSGGRLTFYAPFFVAM